MFGFDKVKHQKFKKNFLKVVIFSLGFKKNSFTEQQIEEITILFKDVFPRFSKSMNDEIEISFNDENIDILRNEQILKFRSSDGNRVIYITDDALSFQITGASYECFDKIRIDLQKISDFLSLCNISTITKLTLRKINLIEFKNSNTPSDVLIYLLNPNLVTYLNAIPNNTKINHCVQALKYRDGNSYLNIKYGLIVPPKLEQGRGQLVIDIDLHTEEDIDPKKMIEVSEKINQEIFNVFNWLINDDTRKILLNGESY